MSVVFFLCNDALKDLKKGGHGEIKLSMITQCTDDAPLVRIVVNESPGIVYTGIMNDKGVRYTLVRHRNERHEQNALVNSTAIYSWQW